MSPRVHGNDSIEISCWQPCHYGDKGMACHFLVLKVSVSSHRQIWSRSTPSITHHLHALSAAKTVHPVASGSCSGTGVSAATSQWCLPSSASEMGHRCYTKGGTIFVQLFGRAVIHVFHGPSHVKRHTDDMFVGFGEVRGGGGVNLNPKRVSTFREVKVGRRRGTREGYFLQ